MQVESNIFKVGVNIPPEFLQTLMDSINDNMESLYPLYDRTFNYWPVKGTWRPLPGSTPYNGTIGKIVVADEIRTEFTVREKDLKKVLEIIRDVHPYQEPVIDVIPMIEWKRITPSDAD